MNLYLLRHTQVALPAGICYGQTDVALKSSYAEEWEKILSQIGGKTFETVFSSPLSRCRLLAQHISPTIIEDPRLMELNFGLWEGTTWDEIYESKEGKEWFDDYFNATTPNGESYTDLIERVEDFIRDLQERTDDVLIVTHAGVIRAFMHLLDGISVDEAFKMPIEYGALITYRNINISSFAK